MTTSLKGQTAKKWKSPSLRWYHQLWPQLMLLHGVVCRKYSPGPLQHSVTVPVLLHTLQHVWAHDTPATEHQGQEKTFAS